MEADLQSFVAFYLTGKKQPTRLDDIAALKLRPALFSTYRDLTALRYDYPLVLLEQKGGAFAEPLSRLVDQILAGQILNLGAHRVIDVVIPQPFLHDVAGLETKFFTVL